MTDKPKPSAQITDEELVETYYRQDELSDVTIDVVEPTENIHVPFDYDSTQHSVPMVKKLMSDDDYMKCCGVNEYEFEAIKILIPVFCSKMEQRDSFGKLIYVRGHWLNILQRVWMPKFGTVYRWEEREKNYTIPLHFEQYPPRTP